MKWPNIKKENIVDEYKVLYLFYAILCHDLGKPFCTEVINGKITSYKHESLGIEPTLQKLLLRYYSKKYNITIFHVVNGSPNFIFRP